ncbi:MAG TPA: ribonuclease H-like domain-containing protein [archaeon]|nr:ribonuclease H-like domain-containing protein [archaeon]
MGNFYFDIETTGLDAKKEKVITIQYQELNRFTGAAIGKLTILKEWESSEKEILGKFIGDMRILDPYAFTFIPVGYNLNFEHNFLKERTAQHGYETIDILNKPSIDLRPLGILMNGGEFKGSGLDKITGKKMSGSIIPQWYAAKEYPKIIEYIEDEAKSFIQLNEWLYKEMPKFLERFKKENGINK